MNCTECSETSQAVIESPVQVWNRHVVAFEVRSREWRNEDLMRFLADYQPRLKWEALGGAGSFLVFADGGKRSDNGLVSAWVHSESRWINVGQSCLVVVVV